MYRIPIQTNIFKIKVQKRAFRRTNMDLDPESLFKQAKNEQNMSADNQKTS